MGIWINEPMLCDPASVERAVEKLADSGLGMVRLFLRNSNFNHRSPEFVATVARAVQKAHERGILAVLDCEPHLIVGSDMGRQYPDEMGCKLVRAVGKVSDGHWLMRVDTPSGSGDVPIYDGIEAAFLRVEGALRKVDLEFLVRREQTHYQNGGIHRETTPRESLSHSATQSNSGASCLESQRARFLPISAFPHEHCRTSGRKDSLVTLMICLSVIGGFLLMG